MSVDNSVERAAFRVAALVISQVRRTEIGEELGRLNRMPRVRARAFVGSVLLGLFILACISALFGWIGLALYFAAIVLLIR